MVQLNAVEWLHVLCVLLGVGLLITTENAINIDSEKARKVLRDRLSLQDRRWCQKGQSSIAARVGSILVCIACPINWLMNRIIYGIAGAVYRLPARGSHFSAAKIAWGKASEIVRYGKCVFAGILYCLSNAAIHAEQVTAAFALALLAFVLVYDNYALIYKRHIASRPDRSDLARALLNTLFISIELMFLFATFYTTLFFPELQISFPKNQEAAGFAIALKNTFGIELHFFPDPLKTNDLYFDIISALNVFTSWIIVAIVIQCIFRDGDKESVRMAS